MSLFENFSDRFWSYVSPRKTQERREKPFKTPALPAIRTTVKRTGGAQVTPFRSSMSPRSRVASWKMASSDITRPAELRAPFATPSIGGATPPPEPDFEGDTLLDNVEEYEGQVQEEFHDYDVNDETMVDEEYNLKEEFVIDIEAERMKWAAKAKDMQAEGWNADAIDIYVKIGMRGNEPLLPAEWAFDFRTLPYTMFSHNDKEISIKALSGKQFRGSKALQDLLFLGRNIRDAKYHVNSNRRAHDIAQRAVKAYMKWAFDDGHVTKPSDIPTIAVEAGGLETSAPQLERNMRLRFHRLAERYREALRIHQSTEDEDDVMSHNPPSEVEYTIQLPTLYGIIASHTVLAFVSYDLTDFQPEMRSIGVFNFNEGHTDVWNSLAIAQFVVHARNGMIKMQPYTMHTVDEMEYEVEDPDA